MQEPNAGGCDAQQAECRRPSILSCGRCSASYRSSWNSKLQQTAFQTSFRYVRKGRRSARRLPRAIERHRYRRTAASDQLVRLASGQSREQHRQSAWRGEGLGTRRTHSCLLQSRLYPIEQRQLERSQCLGW